VWLAATTSGLVKVAVQYSAVSIIIKICLYAKPKIVTTKFKKPKWE
jgi:hypothetical protein